MQPFKNGHTKVGGRKYFMGGCKMTKMNYILSPEAIRHTIGSSKGTQVKYFENNWWYKRDMTGYEGLAEVIVSDILSCSNVSDFVKYEPCTIHGIAGCRSLNFLKENEQNISFQRAYEMYFDGQLSERLHYFDKPIDKLHFVTDFFEKYYELDVTAYLCNILYLDMLTLNPDRHFNNLSIILGADNQYHTAPIFDNGAALLSSFELFPPDVALYENIDRVIGQPFSISLETQARLLPCSLKIDYNALYEKLTPYTGTRAYTVLEYQLERYRDLFYTQNLDLDIEQELE